MLPETPDARLAIEVEETAHLEIEHEQAELIAFGSQLLSGSVGLNAAHRVYRARGIQLIEVPTILLSVLPHYPSVHHVKIPASWIAHALGDLAKAEVLNGVEMVTSGYLASPDQAEEIAHWYDSLPQETRRPPLVLDPTLGDTGLGFYTEPAVADALRSTLVPLATGITPNLFELAYLTGESIHRFDSLGRIEEAARSLMGPYTAWIVVTGVDVSASGQSENAREIGEVLITTSGIHLHRHTATPTSAKGVGDIFTAALNTALLRGADIHKAVDTAAAEALTHIRPQLRRN